MELIYKTEVVKNQCKHFSAAKKFFGGNEVLAKSLLARINFMEGACCLKDIIAISFFRFHKLLNKNNRNLDGYFAVDVKTKVEPWRIIIQPLNENKEEYNPCRIDEIASIVTNLAISEVSKHYE